MPEVMTLPRAATGRISWKTFLGDAKPGDSFVLPISLQQDVSTNLRRHGFVGITRSNADGTFTLTIGGSLGRQAILASFAALPEGSLRALHDAAKKSGLFN